MGDGSVSAVVTPLEEGDTAGRSSSSDAPSSTSRFVSVAGPVTESIMDRLRGEGYVYVGRQRTSSTFVPHLSQRSAEPAAATAPAAAAGHKGLVSVVLPEGDVYYRPYSGHSHHGVTQLDPSPPLHGSARTASGSGTSRSASGQAPGSASSAPAASAAQRERQLNVLNTDDRTEVYNSSVGYVSSVLRMRQVIGSSTYGCSAALVGRAVAVTAAHCLYDVDTDSWAASVTVFAGAVRGAYDSSAAVVRYVVHQGYVDTDGSSAYDIAVVYLDRPLGDIEGYLGAATSCSDTQLDLQTAGYPGDKPSFTLWTTNCTVHFPTNVPGAACLPGAWEHTCDAYQGQSGSSMWDPQGRVRSVLVAGLGYKSTNLATPLQQEMFQTVMEGRAWTGTGWGPSTQPRYPPAPPPDRAPVRLMVGSSPGAGQGRVELQVNGVWGTVCDDYWTDAAATVVCRQLGFKYGTAVPEAHFGQGAGPIYLSEVLCTGEEVSLEDCYVYTRHTQGCTHREDAGVLCSDSFLPAGLPPRPAAPPLAPALQPGAPLRLVGGSAGSSGRVELYANGVWGTVCDDGWDDTDATVVCRQLGYERGVARQNAFFGSGTGPILLWEVGCGGDEQDLLSCPSAPAPDCEHWEDAGVVCYGGASGPSAPSVPPPAAPPPPPSPLPPSAPPPLLAGAEFRLVDGNGTVNGGQGRVEVFYNGTWGTVCDDSWDDVDASVLCRQMGHMAGLAVTQAYFGQGSGPIVMDQVDCWGLEASLAECAFDPTHDCTHAEDAGVLCFGLSFPAEGGDLPGNGYPPSAPSAPQWPSFPPSVPALPPAGPGSLRLVDGSRTKGSKGLVEVRRNGAWGAVCDDGFWDDAAAMVVCRQLGFEGGEVRRGVFGSSALPYAIASVSCMGTEQDLLDCAYYPTSFCSQDRAAGVLCSGPNRPASAPLHTMTSPGPSPAPAPAPAPSIPSYGPYPYGGQHGPTYPHHPASPPPVYHTGAPPSYQPDGYTGPQQPPPTMPPPSPTYHAPTNGPSPNLPSYGNGPASAPPYGSLDVGPHAGQVPKARRSRRLGA